MHFISLSVSTFTWLGGTVPNAPIQMHCIADGHDQQAEPMRGTGLLHVSFLYRGEDNTQRVKEKLEETISHRLVLLIAANTAHIEA